jgi:hypothetical protein
LLSENTNPFSPWNCEDVMVAITTKNFKKSDGLPKSGRFWKTKQVCKTSLTVDVPQIREAYRRKREQRQTIAESKKLFKEYNELEKEEARELKRRAQQKRLAKEENRKKAEIVQVVCLSDLVQCVSYFSLVLDFQPKEDQEDVKEAIEAD